MGANFTPKGDIAEWRMIHEFVKDMQPDAIITYETLTTLLGREFPGKNRQPIVKAAQELRQLNERTLVSVHRVGYRVARANEHMKIAKGHQTRARNQVLKAVEVLDATRRDELTTAEAKELDRQAHVAYQLRDAMNSQERRLDSHEEDIEAITNPVQSPPEPDRVEVLTERVDGLSERMQALLEHLETRSS